MDNINVVLVTTCTDWAGINGSLVNETHSFSARDLIEWVQPHNGARMTLNIRRTNEAFADALQATGDGLPALLAGIDPEAFDAEDE